MRGIWFGTPFLSGLSPGIWSGRKFDPGGLNSSIRGIEFPGKFGPGDQLYTLTQVVGWLCSGLGNSILSQFHSICINQTWSMSLQRAHPSYWPLACFHSESSVDTSLVPKLSTRLHRKYLGTRLWCQVQGQLGELRYVCAFIILCTWSVLMKTLYSTVAVEVACHSSDSHSSSSHVSRITPVNCATTRATCHASLQ